MMHHHRRAPATLLSGLVLCAAASAQTSGAEALLDGAKAGFDARTFYMNVEDKSDPPTVARREAWAIGGKLYGRTGWWADTLQFGASYYLSAPLYGPDDKDGTLLLEPGQNTISTLGELFARLKFGEAGLTAGRQEIELSPVRPEGTRANRGDGTFVGKQDNRMVPVTYEAVLGSAKVAQAWDFHLGWVNRVKPRNLSEFQSVGSAVGAATSDADMWFGGAQFALTKDFLLQGWYYQVPDVIRIGWLDGDYVWRLDGSSHLRFAAQYADQRSDGSNLLTGQSFSTSTAQAYAEYGAGMLTLYGAYSRTDSGAALRLPFSSGPIYTNQIMRTFVRANESAWQLGAGFNLAQWMPGLSAYADVTRGSDAINSSNGAALADATEYDLGVLWVYREKGSWIDGLRSRVRYAWTIDATAVGDQRSKDLRIDLNLPISLL